MAITGSPDLKTPCICGGGVGLGSSAISEDEFKLMHSDFCLRFMATCDEKNRNKTKPDIEGRSVDSLIHFVS
jgi:hypothetical protein